MASNKKTGRKTKLTPELIERICEFIVKGNYISTACKTVGISESTYYGWLKRAEEGDTGIFVQFAKAAKQAEAQAEAELLAIVREAATTDKNWLAAMTFLERRYPERWGRKDRHQVEMSESRQITITHVEVVKDYGSGKHEIEGEVIQIPKPETYRVGKPKEDNDEDA